MSNKATFRTDRLPLATFIHASGLLQYLGCEPGGNSANFVFADPQGAGSRTELDFERGAVCAATALFASQKFLRREIDKIRSAEDRGNGNKHFGR